MANLTKHVGRLPKRDHNTRNLNQEQKRKADRVTTCLNNSKHWQKFVFPETETAKVATTENKSKKKTDTDPINIADGTAVDEDATYFASDAAAAADDDDDDDDDDDPTIATAKILAEMQVLHFIHKKNK